MRHMSLRFALFVIFFHSATPAIAQTQSTPGLADSTPTRNARQAQPDEPDKGDPVLRVFHNLFSDLRALATKDTAEVLAFGVSSGAAARPFDYPVARRVGVDRSGQVWRVGEVVGSIYVQIGAALGTYTIGRLGDHPVVSHIGSDLIRAQVLNGFLTHAVKLGFQRERPNGGNLSFPSGHTSSTFASASVLWRHFGWKVGSLVSLAAAFVGTARVGQGEHFVSDAMVGAAIGIASARTVTLGHGGTELAVAPMAVPGGAAVIFTVAVP